MAIASEPRKADLIQLKSILNSGPIDREMLDGALRTIGDTLRKRGRELDRSGGLLDESEQVDRMGLAREDDKLRDDIDSIELELDGLRDAAKSGMDDWFIRDRGLAFLSHLQLHLDAEARLVLESTTTEVGAGD